MIRNILSNRVALLALLCIFAFSYTEAREKESKAESSAEEKSEEREDEDENKNEEDGDNENESEDEDWTESFAEEPQNFSSKGRNGYFVLEPGYQLVLQGKEKGDELQLVITVLDETKKIGNVETRVVEEKETKNGELVEISRNFFALSTKTNNVYYFGEEVDIYSKGKIVSHDGAWIDGQNGAKYGLMLPGSILLGARYYQEIAPGVAMDRAEILSMTETVETPAVIFKNCLETEEGTALDKKQKDYKYYAPGIGLIKDGPVKLVKYGTIQKEKK